MALSLFQVGAFFQSIAEARTLEVSQTDRVSILISNNISATRRFNGVLKTLKYF
jgi:hypothetical protein